MFSLLTQLNRIESSLSSLRPYRGTAGSEVEVNLRLLREEEEEKKKKQECLVDMCVRPSEILGLSTFKDTKLPFNDKWRDYSNKMLLIASAGITKKALLQQIIQEDKASHKTAFEMSEMRKQKNAEAILEQQKISPHAAYIDIPRMGEYVPPDYRTFDSGYLYCVFEFEKQHYHRELHEEHEQLGETGYVKSQRFTDIFKKIKDAEIAYNLLFIA